jgi:hypothetical protein
VEVLPARSRAGGREPAQQAVDVLVVLAGSDHQREGRLAQPQPRSQLGRRERYRGGLGDVPEQRDVDSLAADVELVDDVVSARPGDRDQTVGASRDRRAADPGRVRDRDHVGRTRRQRGGERDAVQDILVV